MAAKKRVQKKAKKTSSRGRAGSSTFLSGRVRNIRYKCSGGCKATPKFAHMSPGDVVNMLAINTDVKIDFNGASPFQSGADPIVISEGSVRTEVVGSSNGTFPYTLSCSKCQTGNIPPEMIVP
jgi:hypothetical protein